MKVEKNILNVEPLVLLFPNLCCKNYFFLDSPKRTKKNYTKSFLFLYFTLYSCNKSDNCCRRNCVVPFSIDKRVETRVGRGVEEAGGAWGVGEGGV